MTKKLIATLVSIAGEGWLRMLAFVLLFLGLSAVAPYLIYQELGSQPLVLDSQLLTLPVLAGVLVLLLVYFAADGLRLLYTLRALGQDVPFRCIWPLVFINIFFSNITPMATGGGVGQVWYLQRLSVPIGTAMAATTVRTLLAMLFIFIPAPILVLSMESLQNQWGGAQLGYYLGLIAAGYLGFFAVVLWRMRWVMLALQTLFSLLHRLNLLSLSRRQKWSRRTWRELLRFRIGVKAYFCGSRVAILLSVFYTALFLLALFSLPALLFWALAYDIDYLRTLSLMLVTTFLMYFAPTPGAAGIAEGLFGYFFMALVTSEDLLLVILVWRFLTIHLGMLIGALVTLRHMSKRGNPL